MRYKPYCGIYLILNHKTLQAYVGQSVDCRRRINEHYSRNNSEIDKALSEDPNSFYVYYLKRCKAEKLGFWEDYYIAKYNAYENGYNQKFGKYYLHFRERFKA